MSKSRGPSLGYRNGPKAQYRRNLWAFADEQLRAVGKPVGQRRVLILDTRQGQEYRLLLSRGYRPQNVWVVNDNPAELALLSMDLKFETGRLCHPVGLDLDEAIRRLSREGLKFDAINLDFCSQQHSLLMRTINDAGHLLLTPAVFAVTVQRGRENEQWMKDAAFSAERCEFEYMGSSSGLDVRSLSHYKCSGWDWIRIKSLAMAMQAESWKGQDGDEDLQLSGCARHIIAQRLQTYKSDAAKVTMLSMAALCGEHTRVVQDELLRAARDVGITPAEIAMMSERLWPTAPPCGYAWVTEEIALRALDVHRERRQAFKFEPGTVGV